MFRSASHASFLVIGLATLSLSACGGSLQTLPSAALPTAGGGPTGGGGTSTGAAHARVTLVIKLPRKAVGSKAVLRRPHYVSPSIASATVTVTATGFPATSVTSNVVCSTAVPPACTVTASILAPVQQQDTFSVISYDGPNATGNVLSRGSLVYPVSAGTAEQIPIVLQGTVASIVAVSIANANPLTGTSATSSVSVTAADADGNVIAGQYQKPVTLQLFESDSEGLFSFAAGGAVVATGSVAGSATPVTVYLKAKADTTTPDDATIVGTVAGAPFVPGGNLSPPPIIGEITTACPPTSSQCVYYPSALQIVGDPSVNSWGTSPAVFPGAPQDSAGANSIWSVPTDFGQINHFNTTTDSFSIVTTSAPALDVATDIAGSFWGAETDPTSGVLGVAHVSLGGAQLAFYPLTTAATPQGGGIPTVGATFDSTGQLWVIDGSYIYAINPTTGVSTACSFASTDANFANASVAALGVAGNVIWMGVNGAADGNSYVFKVPAQITSSGCNLTTLETAANKFELSSLAGQFDVNQIVVDAAGNAYAFLVSSVWKITPAGQAIKLIDTGTALTQVFAGGTLDPSATFLYLVDPDLGALYKASATAPSTGLLPSIPLPPVFGIVGNYPSFPYYVPFFTPDGTLWLGAAPFNNAALPFSLLGNAETLGGLEQIRLARATFALRAAASPRTRAELLRLLHSPRTLRYHVHRRAKLR